MECRQNCKKKNRKQKKKVYINDDNSLSYNSSSDSGFSTILIIVPSILHAKNGGRVTPSRIRQGGGMKAKISSVEPSDFAKSKATFLSNSYVWAERISFMAECQFEDLSFSHCAFVELDLLRLAIKVSTQSHVFKAAPTRSQRVFFKFY